MYTFLTLEKWKINAKVRTFQEKYTRTRARARTHTHKTLYIFHTLQQSHCVERTRVINAQLCSHVVQIQVINRAAERSRA